jgi:hypothetical protein
VTQDLSSFESPSKKYHLHSYIHNFTYQFTLHDKNSEKKY